MNQAFITEIATGNRDNCIIGTVAKDKTYRIKFTPLGDCAFRLFLKDTDGNIIRVLNRIVDVIAEDYEYMLRPPVDGFIMYETNGKAMISNIVLEEVNHE